MTVAKLSSNGSHDGGNRQSGVLVTQSQLAAESTTTMLSIYDVRVAARITGSGEPVLLLNGLNRPMQSWASFGDALRSRTVITLDVPGVGASETPVVPYLMPMLSDIAVRVLDEFGVATADVVGFSFGGAVAQQIAFGHPSRVNRLVLLATFCRVGSVPGRAHDVTRILLRPNEGTRWAQPDPLGLLWQIAAISPGPVSATSAA